MTSVKECSVQSLVKTLADIWQIDTFRVFSVCTYKFDSVPVEFNGVALKG